MTLLTVSCAAEPPCEPPSGVFRTQLRELSGDCGPVDSQLETTDRAEALGCKTVDLPAGEGCGQSYRRTCSLPDGSRVEMLVAVDRQDDDVTWSGTADLRLYEGNGAPVCHSLYAITFSPQ